MGETRAVSLQRKETASWRHGVAMAVVFMTVATAVQAAQPSAEEHPRAGADATGRGEKPAERETWTAPPIQFANLHGKAIRGSHGERLGEIADVVVDVSAGELPYVLVASPLAPAEGYRLRLVPTGALEPAQRGGGFMVPFESSQWRSLESIDARQLQAGALRAFEAHRQELARVFGFSQARAEPSRLYLATHLRGKSLRNGDATLGTVEAILAGPDRRKALTLIRRGGSEGPRTFVVPLARLQLPAFDAEYFTTDLSRQELESAGAVNIDVSAALAVSQDVQQILAASVLSQSSMTGQTGYASSPTAPGAAARGASVPTPLPPAAPRDENLTPTGRSSQDVNTGRIEAALAAVRQALAQDPAVRAANLEVEVLGGRLVLRGTAPNAAIRQRAEEVAKRTAPQAPLENRIAVPGR